MGQQPTEMRTRHSPSRRVRIVLPPQHGAWAMLAVPYVLGTLAAGWTWAALPLLLVWLLGYLFSYSALMALRVRRRERFVASARLTAALAAPFAGWLVVARPWVLLAWAAFVPMALVNIWYARRRDERAWPNSLASVTNACLMVFLAYGVGEGTDWRRAGVLFVIAWLYFAGTVFYVKTMIRERGSVAYYYVSLGEHAVATLVATWVSPWLGLVFAWFLLRAALMPRLATHRRLRPVQVGLIELFNAVLLVVVALLVT
jgi:hypothetical protein